MVAYTGKKLGPDVKIILTRVLYDEDFLNLMLTNPEEALKAYNLSADEKSALLDQKLFYEMIQSIKYDIPFLASGLPIAALGMIVIVIVVVVVVVSQNTTVTVTVGMPDIPGIKKISLDAPKVKSISEGIRGSSGDERYTKILDMLELITGRLEVKNK